MQPRISVLIVDDSAAYRNALRDVLASDPGLDVVGQASNGRLALPRIRYHKPAVVILDQEMPEMDGLSTLAAIREEWPAVHVIMFSSRTQRGAETTVKALQLGAADFLAKPAEKDTDIPLYLRSHLLPRIHALGQRFSLSYSSHMRSNVTGDFKVAALGISTGGPPVLKTILNKLNRGLHASVLIVQHMPPVFTAQLARSLSETSGIPVKEAEDAEPLAPGFAYIAPGGRHLEVSSDGSQLRITDGDPELSCRPSVNVLFRSVARAFGPQALGLILTGMGEDGYSGIQEIRARGGKIIAQSQDSCLIFGMPARPVREGLVDAVLSPDKIAERLNELFAGVRT
ncbi:MAG TPA: chemotaxis-specific protein-glutamate methyltransferase CheB [Leptospiraceae bacterium]|nr:chemotaxis-specific protein-glutamate methyltransferase CheB [Leptospirales bacterium]HMU84412.1 chemotaxis-specific protein-glutamate methyltransferase CheB [Leptospiraceae bacterium]HMW61059.1 chemotaxis-specific protein-glutamate methyltransferase CheB [Leptospiraceae bacterium]HMX56785.1 chemotaxis-specific protein-glutamate methyltransferase CheB [Leptospiraceae bacterium]HMY46720.1 chemotaxis-specific protein-glutamate methyltransferase CheB [Leptospiraceae bacterium]